MPVFAFHGDDSFSAREEIARLRTEYLADDVGGLNYVVLDGNKLSIDTLVQNCDAFPFMASYRVVVVDNLLSRLSNKLSDSSDSDPAPTGMAAQITEVVSRVPGQTILIFIDEKKVDSRNSVLKAITKHGEQREFPIKKGLELQKWIKQRAKKQKFKMTESAVAKLAESVPGDLYALAHEMEKLAAYAGPDRTVDSPDVDLLVTAAKESMIWDLTDGIMRKNASKALAAAENLMTDGWPIPWILTKIVDHFRQLILVKEGSQRGWTVADVQRELGLKEYPAKKNLEQARTVTMRYLEDIYPLLVETDAALKTRRMLPNIALEVLIAKLAS